MTLMIKDHKSGKLHEFHYQDAVIDGDVVYLNRGRSCGQQVWNREDVSIEANEGDHVYLRDSQSGEMRDLRSNS
jgi:hypothetical protein